MAGLLKWIRNNTTKLLDPDRDARIESAASHIERELASQRKSFSLDAVLRSVELFTDEVPLATRRAYSSLLNRAWRDGAITEGEQRTLTWAAQSLGLSEQASRELQREVGLSAFQDALARAIDDGVLDDREIQFLQQFAGTLGWPLGRLMREYFATECSGLLRGLFLSAIADGKIAAEEWSRLVETAQKLGLSRTEFLDIIQHPAERFVEQCLADAKADERITQSEEGLLSWLLANIIARVEFRHYVQSEIGAVKLVQSIESGQLPSIKSQRLGLRAGEIVHAESPARFVRVKQLKSGPRQEICDGRVTLTDDRLLFDSPELGLDLNHRRVLDLKTRNNGFEVAMSGKGTGAFLPAVQPSLFTRMYRVAIRKTNQTIVMNPERSRHISRDVRQRVWQRYGGQCVECGARDYLEFDHIIPVAKGGNNSESNVQLLCRRCNGKKSDLI